jgi:hypothetical protein
MSKDKEINSLSHSLVLVSELIERAVKTPLERSRGEKLYKE